MYKSLIFSLMFFCVFSLSCSTEPELASPPASEPTPIPQIKIEGDFDPNTVAVVTFRLEGKTLPGTPKVVPADDAVSALFERMGIAAELRSIGDNNDTWIGIFEPGDSYVIGWIVQDNERFRYCSEPFVASNGLVVKFSPGMPVSFEYEINNIPDDVQVFPAQIILPIKTTQGGRETFVSFGIQEEIDKLGVVKITGLAPGTYQLLAHTMGMEEYAKTRTRFLYDRREIDIKAGSENQFRAIYPEVDTTIEKGDVTIYGMLYNSVGEVQSDEPVQLIPYNDEGPLPGLYYPDAITGPDGRFEFKGVHPNMNVLIKYGWAGISLREDSMKENATFWLDLMYTPVTIPLVAGNAVQEFTIKWEDGQTGKLADFHGKIVVMSLWASWCPPSREAMSELNSLASEFSDNGDIVFISLSVDPSLETWEQAMDKTNWKALRNGWFEKSEEQDPPGFNRPIPYSLILNEKNIIAAVGYELDIKEELKKIIEAENSTEN